MRTGSVCTGYTGLDLAVHEVLGGELAWVADNDEGAAKILAHRFPGVPNLGDITVVDWSAVEPVDVLTAGFPCQDVSAAGKRAGLRKGTRSGVWTEVCQAIAALRPGLVVIENVRGLLTARGDEPTDEHLKAEADRDVILRLGLPRWLETERRIAVAKGDWDRARRCQVRASRIMGLRRRAVARCEWHERRLVRAIGTVLGSLADLFYDARGAVVSAADAGAPHQRERVFIVAWPAADAQGERRARGDSAQPDLELHGQKPAHAGSYGRTGRIAADSGGGELQRRGIPGILGGAPSAEPSEGDQRERAGHPAGDSGPATAADAERDGWEGRQRPARAHEAGTPADDGGRGSARGHSAAADAYGQDAGPNPRGGGAAAPAGPVHGPGRRREPGPGVSGGAAANAARHGRDERRPEPAGLVGGPDAAERGHGPAPDAASHRYGNAGTAGERGIPATVVSGAPADAKGAAWGEPESEHLAAASGRAAEPGECPSALAWGAYEPAIRRWEAVTGRLAPAPTEPGRTGQRLSPRFVEWMMGLPEGWVTDVPGLSRNAQLKALGNGVVPQQAATALRLLLERADIPPLVAAEAASEARGAA